MLCPCVYRIELKFPLCFHFVEGLCSLREFVHAGRHRVEAEAVAEGRGRKDVFVQSIDHNKTDSRGCVCVCLGVYSACRREKSRMSERVNQPCNNLKSICLPRRSCSSRHFPSLPAFSRTSFCSH